jgi:hypothetical protein
MLKNSTVSSSVSKRGAVLQAGPIRIRHARKRKAIRL